MEILHNVCIYQNITDKTHAGLMFMMICMKHVSFDVPSIHAT